MLVSSAHCAAESPHALAQMLAAAAHRDSSSPLPLSAPHDCAHESGCLCRGATPVHSFDVSAYTVSDVCEWLFESESDWAPLPLGLSRAHRLPTDNPRPLSGRQLRALLASLLI